MQRVQWTSLTVYTKLFTPPQLLFGFCNKAAQWVAARGVPVIRSLIDACRRKGVAVIYTTSDFGEDGWNRGSWEWKNARTGEDVSRPRESNRKPSDIVDEITPAPQDIVIRKLKPSAFFGSPLTSYLTLLSADSIIVAGTTTSSCVRGTVIDAFSENLRVTLDGNGFYGGHWRIGGKFVTE